MSTICGALPIPIPSTECCLRIEAVSYTHLDVYKRQDILHVDVLMVTVTPPDEHGYCNVGVSSDYTMEAAKAARVVLAEVNDQVPTVFGNTYIHVDDIAAFVEYNRPLPESKPCLLYTSHRSPVL